MGLSGIIQDCERISDELKERFDSLPKVETCVHSYIPQGRLFCEKLQIRVSTAYCESCSEYKSKMEGE